MQEETGKKHDKRLDNLIPGANKNGRPKGQRNYKTIYREALKKIGESRGMTPEEIETEMEQAGLEQALKGNFQFQKDIKDRIHGKAEDNVSLEGNFVIKWKDEGDSN